MAISTLVHRHEPTSSARHFSSTSCLGARKRVSRLRRKFYEWLSGPGANFRIPLPGSTNYLSAYDPNGHLRTRRPQQEPADEDDASEATNGPNTPSVRPFPLNKHFQSSRVLSEELRQAIYDKVKKEGMSVRETSTLLRVSMERVGAVVRLKEIEKQWTEEGKRLATPYAKAVLNMLPQTPWKPRYPERHESINDLPVHPATTQQIFHPTSESRQFTREDAARVFDLHLLPADKRIPHPQQIMEARMRLEEWSPEAKNEVYQQQREEDERKRAKRVEQTRKEQSLTNVVEGRRWDFRFKKVFVSPESVGWNGRAPSGVGWRYGFPHEDRKKGQVRIPTRVD